MLPVAWRGDVIALRFEGVYRLAYLYLNGVFATSYGGEPGSNGDDPVHGDPQVNNTDHLTLVTTDIQSYVFGSFYGGHPAPIRAKRRLSSNSRAR